MSERTVVTKVSNAVLFSDGSIRIDNVRLSYPHLDKAFESEGDDGNKKSSFSVDAMLPKSTHKAAKDLIKKVIEDLMIENDTKVKTENWFLKDGDQSDKLEYEGHWLAKSAEARRPTVRNRDGSVMTEREVADLVYGGCWGNVFLRPWYFAGKAKNGKTYPKRVLANLLGVQFVRNDEPFGEGRISDDGVFGEVDADGDDGFDDDSGL